MSRKSSVAWWHGWIVSVGGGDAVTAARSVVGSEARRFKRRRRHGRCRDAYGRSRQTSLNTAVARSNSRREPLVGRVVEVRVPGAVGDHRAVPRGRKQVHVARPGLAQQQAVAAAAAAADRRGNARASSVRGLSITGESAPSSGPSRSTAPSRPARGSRRPSGSAGRGAARPSTPRRRARRR